MEADFGWSYETRPLFIAASGYEDQDMFRTVRATQADRTMPLPGDNIVPDPDVVMDRAFDLPHDPSRVWPWFVQLGKNRAGWYLPRAIESMFPRRSRALRSIDPSLQNLRVGTIINDWGGRDAYFKVAILEPPHVLVHQSKRGDIRVSWAIVLLPEGVDGTRVHLRLRLGPVRRRFLVETFGGLVDALTIVGLAAGLRERLSAPPGAATVHF